MEKMGITYDRLQKVNPRIVYVRLTGQSFISSLFFSKKFSHDLIQQKMNELFFYISKNLFSDLFLLEGFGQSGPFARKAGHDINYIATSGALSAFRTEKGKPLPPVNILGDFAGGGFLAALGTLLALIERNKSGSFLLFLSKKTLSLTLLLTMNEN